MSIDNITPEEWDDLFEAMAEMEQLEFGDPSLDNIMMADFYQDDEEQLWEGKHNVRDINKMFPEAMAELQKVVDAGGIKHGYGSYLNVDNPSLQTVPNARSMHGHIAESVAGVDKDKDSGADPLLHVALRALMKYTRKVRGVDDAD